MIVFYFVIAFNTPKLGGLMTASLDKLSKDIISIIRGLDDWIPNNSMSESMLEAVMATTLFYLIFESWIKWALKTLAVPFCRFIKDVLKRPKMAIRARYLRLFGSHQAPTSWRAIVGECVICAGSLFPGDMGVFGVCGHASFHLECVQRLHICPLCRRGSDCVKLYL